MSAATPSAATAAIVLENVSYTYPGAERPVLRGVFLEIPRGQCVVVTGASGCGKTTLTRLINGLVPHVYAGEVKGRVMVEGTEVAAWTPDELGVRVGSVFQNPRSQFVNLDVASEIAFGCENLGLPRGEIVARVSKAARPWGSPICSIAASRSFPAARSRRWPSPRPSPWSRRCSCWTSRRPP